MSSDTLQARKTMQAIMGIAPGNVYGIRHDKKGFLGDRGYGAAHPRTFTNLRNARVNANGWGARDDEIHIVELELVEVKEHTRLKKRGGE